MSESIVLAVQSLLLPQTSSGSPLAQPLPIHGSDAISLANQICRVVAEIRTRYGLCNVLHAKVCLTIETNSFVAEVKVLFSCFDSAKMV